MSLKLSWFLFNTALISCLVCGFVFDIAGLRNVALFTIWLTAVLSVLTLVPLINKDLVEKMAQDNRPSAPLFARNTVIFITIAALVWFGALWTAGAYIVAVVIQKGVRAAVDELRNKTRGVSPEIIR